MGEQIRPRRDIQYRLEKEGEEKGEKRGSNLYS
jgi:hypothetical protein